MEKIPFEEIRGKWEKTGEYRSGVFHPELATCGDDTLKSIQMVADKVNEIVEWINSKSSQLL